MKVGTELDGLNCNASDALMSKGTKFKWTWNDWDLVLIRGQKSATQPVWRFAHVVNAFGFCACVSVGKDKEVHNSSEEKKNKKQEFRVLQNLKWLHLGGRERERQKWNVPSASEGQVHNLFNFQKGGKERYVLYATGELCRGMEAYMISC